MSDIRFTRVRTNGVELHVAEAGPPDGRPLFLLHGFPESWAAWQSFYIGAFAAAGFHVMVPDQRGYGLSDKPAGVAAYDLDVLAADIVGLADGFNARRFAVVGHDWGGTVGWWIATRHPQRLAQLAVMNAPHPSVWREAMRTNPEQRRKSRYVNFFRLPRLPEFLIRRNRFAALEKSLERRSGGPSDAELDRYRTAWAVPGALTAMLNWYRAFLRKDLDRSADVRIEAPVLLIWGERDPFGVRELAEASLRLCAAGRVLYVADATHWVQHEEPDRCREALLEFLMAGGAKADNQPAGQNAQIRS
jgi:pimeloyl-ACP methyl ester carboxylesterase